MRFAADKQRDRSDESLHHMYHRMLTGWVGDLLQARPRIEWPENDPVSDGRNRDWHLLYSGNVLDD